MPPIQTKAYRSSTFLLTLALLMLLAGWYAVWFFLNVPPAEPESENIIVKQEDKFASWKTYRNEEYGFEIKYPADWYEQDFLEDQWSFQSKPFSHSQNVSGGNMPSQGLWISIVKDDKCSEYTGGNYEKVVYAPESVKSETYTLEKTECKNGFYISSGLWGSENEKQEKAMLNQILSTVKFISTSTNP